MFLAARPLASVALGAATCLASPAALAKDSPPMVHRDPALPPAQQTSPATRRVFAVAIEELPKESIPAFPVGDAPSQLPAASETTGLHLVNTAGKPVPRAKLASVGKSDGLRFAGRGDEKVAVFMGAGSNMRGPFENLSVPIVRCGEEQGIVPIRWERLSLDEHRAATLEIDDGWFDKKTCQFAPTAHAAVHPKVLASRANVPVLLGMRSDDALTFFLPPDARALAEASFGHVTVVRSLGWRFTLPFGRGGSAALVTPIAPGSLQTWLAGMMPSAAFVGGSKVPSEFVLGVDVVESVSEARPTVLVRMENLREDVVELDAAKMKEMSAAESSDDGPVPEGELQPFE